MHTITEFDDHQRYRGFSPATIRRRRWTLRAICIETGKPLDHLTTVDVEGFLSRRRSPETRSALLADLRAYFRWGVARGRAPVDPTVGLERPKVPKREPNPLTYAEVRALFDGADPRVRRMIALGVYAGLRVSEIGAIDCRDLYPPAFLVVRNGKGGKDRTVPMHPRLLAELAGVEVGPVVGMAGHTVSNVLRRRLDACGLHHHRPHDLRATFATEAVRVAPIPTVAKWLGHSNWTTTQRYVQVSGGDDVIGEMFPKAA